MFTALIQTAVPNLSADQIAKANRALGELESKAPGIVPRLAKLNIDWAKLAALLAQYGPIVLPYIIALFKGGSGAIAAARGACLAEIPNFEARIEALHIDWAEVRALIAQYGPIVLPYLIAWITGGQVPPTPLPPAPVTGKLVQIDDVNFRDFCKGGKHAAGKGFGYTGPGPRKVLRKFRAIEPIPRAQWPARIKALYESKQDLRSVADAAGQLCKDQDGLGYCWVYGSCNADEVNNIQMGEGYKNLAPESVGGPITGWQNVGGNAEPAAVQLTNYGACTMDFLDAPNSLNPDAWKPGWQTEALDNRFDHGWFDVPADFDTVVTILLGGVDGTPHPIAAGLDWWGHLVCFYAPVMWVNGVLWQAGQPLPGPTDKVTFGVLFRNSWGAGWGDNGYGTLTEDKAVPDGASMPLATGAVIPPGPIPEPVTPSPRPRCKRAAVLVSQLLGIGLEAIKEATGEPAR